MCRPITIVALAILSVFGNNVTLRCLELWEEIVLAIGGCVIFASVHAVITLSQYNAYIIRNALSTTYCQSSISKLSLGSIKTACTCSVGYVETPATIADRQEREKRNSDSNLKQLHTATLLYLYAACNASIKLKVNNVAFISRDGHQLWASLELFCYRMASFSVL